VAAFVITNPVITVNSVDLSDHVTSVTLDDSTADIDTTNFGSSGAHTRIGGLKDGGITIEFQQDYAAGKVDATLWAARGTVITVTVKATSSATSATNPLYSGSYLVTATGAGVKGKVGDLATTSVTWPRSGDLTRTTS
jgi:hypothetical protein